MSSSWHSPASCAPAVPASGQTPVYSATAHMMGYPEFLVHLPLQMPCPRARFQGWLLSPLLSCHLKPTRAPRAHGGFAGGPFVLVTHSVAAELLSPARLALWVCWPLAWAHHSHLPHSFRSLMLLRPFPPSNIYTKLRVTPSTFLSSHG